ncbi:MAG: hypothetical protein AB198_00410 [Parcubacteria bacterium C7867-003]|nr:MAG: hypothetical protein AB198_00410 [Parcubacteria bacterium C7867-003]
MQDNQNNRCDVCGSGNGRCGQCGNMCGWRGNNLLRWFLGIIIITWIFSLGMKFGEVKAYMEQNGIGNHMYYRSGAMPMMGGAWGNTDFTVSTAAAPAMMKAGTVQVIKAN